MTWRGWTILLLVSTAVIWVGYDVVVYIKAGSEATISRVIYETAKEFLVLPVAAGYLMGHFFSPLVIKEAVQSMTKATVRMVTKAVTTTHKE